MMVTTGDGHMDVDGASSAGYHPGVFGFFILHKINQNRQRYVFKGAQRHINGAVQYLVAMATNEWAEQ